MLSKNQIKRLLTHCKKIDKQLFNKLFTRNEWIHNQGWIDALTLVLNGNETTVNNNPINNKETVDATRSDVRSSTDTGSIRSDNSN